MSPTSRSILGVFSYLELRDLLLKNFLVATPRNNFLSIQIQPG